MKTILKLALMPIVVITLASCSENKSASDHEHASSEAAHTDADYPLKNCVVSGEPLGSMGTPVEVVHEGTTVKLCCKSCIDEFKATPEVFVAKLKTAE